MEEYDNNNTNINNNTNTNTNYNKSSSLLNTKSIINETLNTGERKGLIKSFISDTKKAILNPKNHLDYILTDRVLRLTNKDYKYYAETDEREKLNNSTKEIIKQTKDYLRLDSNPLIEEEKIETINNLEQIKNNPLAKYINIDIDDTQLENFKAGQYNSSQNIIKDGTTGIVNYLDQDNEEKQILLTGNELITEDKDNIYISRNNLDNTKVEQEVIIPKHYKKDTKLKDIYTQKELEQLKDNNIKYRTMTDEEWLEEMEKTRTFNYALNKTVTNKVRTLAHNIPDSIKEEIDYLDPMGINEFMFLQSIKEAQEPLVASALLKIKQGQNITTEEEEALWNRKYINYSIMRRGVAFRSRVFSGVIKGVEDNLIGTATMFITDKAIDAVLMALAPITGGATGAIAATRVGTKILKLANKFNKARKTYKTLNYGAKALKWAGLSMAGAKADTLVRTHLFENIPGIDSKQDRLREKKNNWMLKVTDKGNLFIRNLTQDQENFLNYQDNIEQFNEAWSERAIDPIIEGLTKALRIPKPLANSVIAKVLKKVNQAPAVVGTTFDGLLTEHLEEIFGLSMNHLMRANDPDTTYYQALKEYLDPNNFAVSTLNIYIAGGLIKTVSNAITENPNNNETQSIDRTVVKNYFKRKFEKNPNEITLNNKYNSIDQYNYERVIDNLPETKIQTLANNILETEDNKSKERYKEGINQIKQNLINLNIPEVETNNLLKIYDTVYSQSALNYGVSRADVLDKMKLEFRLGESNDNNINNKESIDINTDVYDQAINKDLNLNEEINIINIKDLIKNNKNITKEEAKKLIWAIAEKGEQIKTLSEPWIIDIANRRDKKLHLLNSSRYGKFKQQDYYRHNIELNNLKDIINNSLLVERVDNIKENKKPDVEEYFYFYTPITDNKKIYLIRSVAEKLKGEKDLKNVHLYDIIDNQVKMTFPETNKSYKPRSSSLQDTISIKQILQNVKDFNGQNALESYIKENLNNNPETYSQTIHNTKKGRILFRESKAIIELFKNKADQSTLLHESAHYFLKLIQTFSNEGYVMAEQQLQEVMDWTAGKMTKNPALFIHERFARGFEQYVRSGKANNNYLKGVFDYFKGFLERIYKNAEELDIDLNNKQMFEFFDKYLYHPESYNNWVYGDDDDDDNKELNKNNNEEYNINNIKYSNDLTTLILNQSTTTDETLRKAINDRIKEIVNDLERQATFTETEVDNLVIQKLNLDYTNNELNLLLKAIDDLTEEQKLLKKEMENKIELYKDELLNTSPLEFRIKEETEKRYKEAESKGDFRDKTIIAYNVEKEILKDIQIQAIDKIKKEYTEEQIALAGMKDIFDEIIGENKQKQKQKNNIEEDYYLWNKDNWKDEVETEETEEIKKEIENKTEEKEIKENNNNKIENKEPTKPTKTELSTYTYRSLKEQEEIERQREREEKLNIIKRYNTLREQQEEERRESEYLKDDDINLNNSLNDYYNNPITENQRTYVNNIFNILDKLWDKDLKEKVELEKKILNRINRNRIDLLEEAERLGYDAELVEQIKRGFKPYRNVKEMLADYEIRTKDLTFKQQKRNDYKNGLEGIFGEHQLGLAENYYLTNDDYRDIVNFKQRTLKKNINNLLKTIEEQHKILTTAEKTREKYKDYWSYANESIEELKKVINNNIKFNDDFKRITGITTNNLKLIMENTNPSMDTNTLNKIMNTAKKHNNNPDFILKEINRNKAVALKKDIQNTINNLLQHTVSFSKTTGKLYGNILYRDTGLIRTLKQYNRMSMKQAGKELIRITEQKNKGENLTDTQTEYELKKNLLYFRSTPAINLSPENQLEILNSIGNFIKESRNKQKELKANNLMELIKNKNETIDLIKNSKIGKGIFNLSADIIAHKGNLPTLLEYIGGKELANKFDFIPMETAYRVGTKEKTDKLFNRIFDSIVNIKEREDNKTTNKENSKANDEPIIYNQTVNVNDNQNTEQKIIDLTEEFNFIKSTDREQIAKEVENYLNALINKGTMATGTKPLQIEIVKGNKAHIKTSNKKLKGNQQIRQNAAILNLENIINNSILTGEKEVDLTHNTRKATLKHKEKVEKYRYFTTHIGINGNNYDVLLTTEIMKNGKDKNISNLYNIEIRSSFLPRKNDYADETISDKSITPINEKVNSYNQSYNQSTNTQPKETNTNNTQNISQLFEDYSKPVTTLKVIERDNKGYSFYREVRLKERLDTLVDKLIVEMEAGPQIEYTIASINYLKSLNKTARKGGGIRTYKYRLSEYDFGKLKNIIDNTKYKDNNILDDNVKKPYSEIMPYEIDGWGLMYYYLQSKNKATNKLINDYYGTKQIETLNNLLKQQPKEFFAIAEAIFDGVQDRDELNVYYVMEFNKDMGEIDNYFPRVSFHQDDINIFDMLSNNQDRYQKITAIENRSFNAIPNLNNNPLLLALRHIRQTEFTKTIAVELNKFDKIFNSPSVKQNIIDTKGQDIHNAIGKYIEALKYNYREQDDNVEKLLGYMIGNWAKSVTNTPSVFLKQITSFFSYMEDLNPVDFMNNYVEGLSHPMETLNYMLDKSPYIKVRFDGNEYKDLLDIISNNKIKEESPLLSKLKNFNRKTSEVIESITPTETLKHLIKHTLTELGDIASVIYGGYARLQTQLKNGLNERDAILDFERWTMETQQSDFSSLKSKSNLKEGLFNRLAGMFRSQDSQYLQKTMRNFIRYINKEENTKTIRNRMLLYHITLPLMMTLVQGLINTIYGKKDKEWWKYSAEFMTAIAYSFLPLTLLGQSVALDITFDFKNYMKSLMNLQGAITGLPLQAYRSMVKNWKRRIEERKKEKKKEKNKKKKE